MKFPSSFWRAAIALVIFGALVTSLHETRAQTNDCPSKYEGIEHCLTDGENVHVIKIDLTSPNVRFETALAGYETDNKQWIECAAVNVPDFAYAGRGCADPKRPMIFPNQRVEDMLTRYPGAVVAINADYFGPPYDHGPEGLTIKNGERFDGWRKGDCDHVKKDLQGKTFAFTNPTPCQGNDVLRPSLAISKSNRVELGYKMWGDVENAANYAERFWNVVGGGPMLVENGQARSNQTACGTRWPFGDQPDSSKLKDCERAYQSAVGISPDGKTLTLFMVNYHDAEWIAELMTQKYNVGTGMKFDGGGSTQLVYDGRAFYNPESERRVTIALVVFAPEHGVTPPPSSPGNDWGEQIRRWFQERQQDAQHWFDDRQGDAQRWLEDRQRDAQRWVDDRIAEAQRWVEEKIREVQQRAIEELNQQLQNLCSAQLLIFFGAVWVIWRRKR